MNDENKTIKQLTDELSKLRQQVAELETLLKSEYDKKEEVLKKIDNYYDKMVEAIPSVFCLFSANSDQILYVSPAYEKIFGRSREDLYRNPESWSGAIHPDDRNRVFGRDISKLEEGYEIEYRIIRPDGSICWVNDHIYPIKSENGDIDRILSFIEDITESKQIEESLRDSFQRSIDIVKAIPSGLFIYQYEPEDNFFLIDGNPSAEKMTGIEIDKYRGYEMRNIWTVAKEIGLLNKCLSVIKTGEIIEIDEMNYKNKGLDRIFKAKLFRLSENQLGIALENTTDLKKSIEREAQAYALGRIEMTDPLLHNIGNAINSVTTGIGTLQENITNNRLIRHFTLLAKAIKEHQSEFADYVKNDPQGKMVAPFIIALSEDFTRQNEELTRIVNRVKERAQHIADIIRTEKVISGKGIYRKYINPKKAIDDVINILQDSLKKRNIKVIIECNNNQKEICIQESQFHQMLVNLVKNSIEAIDELSILKELSSLSNDMASNSDQFDKFIKIRCLLEKSNFIIEIIDNGIGIEKDMLETIFRPGYTTKDSGSGLGLHSVANFINGYGGRISALSDGIGKGTTMRIVLPLSAIT